MKTNDTERPILFSGEMVRALLREQNPKTQTRRLVKPQPIVVPGWATRGTHREAYAVDGVRFAARTPRETTYAADFLATYADDIVQRFCPYGVPGDRLWVRETWAKVRAVSPATGAPIALGDGERLIKAPTSWTDEEGRTRWNHDGEVVAYRASSSIEFCDGDGFSGEMADRDGMPRWRPSIHMPRALSRITLEVTSVRVERLQDITEEDARAEGVEDRYYRTAFAELWDGINGDRAAWASNPWVWVVGLKRVPPEAGR